jgi:mono/diheme cytochrome c family protein
MYDMKEKYAKLKAGGPNPFIDPAGCKAEFDIDEAMFHAVLQEQQGTSSAAPATNAQAKAPASAASSSASPAGTAAAGGQQSDLVAQGKARFKAYQCFDCHGDNGEGTPDAPDLTHSRLTADQISKFLQKPSADAINKGMPDIPTSSPDNQALVAFVMSLRAK